MDTTPKSEHLKARKEKAELQNRFLERGKLGLTLEIFSSLPRVVFFLKDKESRFVAGSPSLFLAMGYTHPVDLVGSCDHDHTIPVLADGYYRDDQEVLKTGVELRDKDEVFCLLASGSRAVRTTKLPVKDAGGEIIGLMGVVRDPGEGSGRVNLKNCATLDSVLLRTLEFIQSHPSVKITTRDLATAARCSTRDLERYVKGAFGFTPAEFVHHVRFRLVCRMLAESNLPISQVAEIMGIQTASAFSVRFRKQTGTTPNEFRSLWQMALRGMKGCES